MSADREITMMACQGAPAPPLEDDNLLSMILLGLPPLPSSLPRASLVCKRWRRLVTHPHFHRRFLAHHKKAPLLGFFCCDYGPRIDFKPALDPPHRIPPARFSSSLLGENNLVLGCHHGRLLVLNFNSFKKLYLVVWDPITGDRYHVDIPPVFQGHNFCRKGVVVCASREKDHVHGACHSEPFQVVLVGCISVGVFACVYSSETCTWGKLISEVQPQPHLRLSIPVDSQSSLVGNSVYWVTEGMNGVLILEFNLRRQTLAFIDAPSEATNSDTCLDHVKQYFILPEDGGGLSFIYLSCLKVRVWKRISSDHGVAGWLFKNSVRLGNLLSLTPSGVDRTNIQGNLRLVGCDQDGDMIFRLKDSGIIYLINLKTLQFKELPEKTGNGKFAHPFSSFYIAGMHPET